MNDVLDLFNCIVIDESQRAMTNATEFAAKGVVIDFQPTEDQLLVLRSVFKPIDIHTFFTRVERETASLEHLLVKQVLHYIEVYGLGAPGLFNLTTSEGTIIPMRFVHGITVDELAEKVQTLLYTNAPVKDAAQVKRIVEKYNLTFDINKVANNELRVILWHDGLNGFSNGDDAVRYLCYEATGEALLIKSKEVIAAVKKVPWNFPFFEMHTLPLARVFNRHKRIILAAKNKNTANVINRISRLSKTRHVPVRESVTKTFVRQALIHPAFAVNDALSRATMRDKFKFLNLLARKRVQNDTETFKIRNGKVFTTADRPVYDLKDIGRVTNLVLASLADDLSPLRSQTILLDKHVDYGLPVSRKQTVGRLPFGTKVTSYSNELTAGMYWENEWGARDLDLSTIDLDGNRVGWGGRGGYDRNSPVTFSGDLTDARNGAMEFMTSRDADYGLFVNIYSGAPGSKMELVVGENAESKQWIGETLIREKHELPSRDSVIGFVKGKTLVVWAGRLGNSRVSGANPIVNESRADLWTVQRLFTTLGIKFDVDKDAEIEYNHDLNYGAFSIDKLEALFKNEVA